jgi:hypothetical protein
VYTDPAWEAGSHGKVEAGETMKSRLLAAISVAAALAIFGCHAQAPR